jgi:hypothetical protein
MNPKSISYERSICHAGFPPSLYCSPFKLSPMQANLILRRALPILVVLSCLVHTTNLALGSINSYFAVTTMVFVILCYYTIELGSHNPDQSLMTFFRLVIYMLHAGVLFMTYFFSPTPQHDFIIPSIFNFSLLVFEIVVLVGAELAIAINGR